ncbi:hypothetical protein PDIG_61220 [Penicillium digitatum PHI26]|uniref:Zn(2)-C6 fungal-type domain-containing protein n=2 Tax=Penicillium digitatum TaxID=36651 RepID=K9FMF7_PEND2|nr:hypothetical protein PDIP_70650 [Penicillium digitatum Pd1]EKV07889.1 hypothetical protein PDIP_70650 [Penicillium digitatum Pd1]EKV09512.1 hypothetical protein PDIG_61220 [Penicillium digitatum PHI26]
MTTPQCDQKLPDCAKCDQYGQSCPGYDRGLKFITGKPHRDWRQPNPKNDNLDGIRPKSSASNSTLDFKSTYQDLTQREKLSTLLSADMNVVQHICVLIDDFSQPHTPSPTHVVVRRHGFIPTIYGRTRALDATIRSFTAYHFGCTTKKQPNGVVRPISLWGSLACAQSRG